MSPALADRISAHPPGFPQREWSRGLRAALGWRRQSPHVCSPGSRCPRQSVFLLHAADPFRARALVRQIQSFPELRPRQSLAVASKLTTDRVPEVDVSHFDLIPPHASPVSPARHSGRPVLQLLVHQSHGQSLERAGCFLVSHHRQPHADVERHRRRERAERHPCVAPVSDQ